MSNSQYVYKSSGERPMMNKIMHAELNIRHVRRYNLLISSWSLVRSISLVRYIFFTIHLNKLFEFPISRMLIMKWHIKFTKFTMNKLISFLCHPRNDVQFRMAENEKQNDWFFLDILPRQIFLFFHWSHQIVYVFMFKETSKRHWDYGFP